MPTFREDLHLGHKVAMVEADDIVNGSITTDKLADDSVSTRTLQDKCVTEPKIDDDAVSTRTIQDGAVTEPKLADDSVSHRTIQPEAVHGDNIKPGEIGNTHLKNDAVETRNISDNAVTFDKLGYDVFGNLVQPSVDSIDQKYTNITNELYSMIASLQVGGIALSGQFGERTDIGIHQKALTKALGKLWDELATLTGKTYMDFSLTVQPTFIPKEGIATITVNADCLESISDFDDIKFYINNELKAESHDVSVYTQSFNLEDEGTYTIKAVGMILGKTIIKETQVKKIMPFFMGGGQEYQDIMTEEYQKPLVGTLEGDYDLVVKQDGQHMFIIIPASHKDEFRRVNMKTPDMSGFEIPVDLIFENQDYVVYKSKAENGYIAGTYNVDININS